MTATTKIHCIAHFIEPDINKSNNIFLGTTRHNVYTNSQRYNHFCSLSMNGCQARDPRTPVGMTETRTFQAVSSPAMAMERLNSAVSELGFDPPMFGSGIIRLEVPIEEETEAIDWLRAQQFQQHLSRCFFSGRRQPRLNNGYPCSPLIDYGGNIKHDSSLVSIAGLGSAVFFGHTSPFSLHDWRSIKRFLSKKCPLIRAYGAIRFDALANISSEWEAFGSFYFMIPQVEFNEFEGSSMLVTTIAWDESLSWTFGKAVHALQGTMRQVSTNIVKLRKEVPNTSILSSNNVPSKKLWDFGVNRALQMINKDSSPLTKKGRLAAGSEALYRSLETYLRCFAAEQPKNWSFWLPWAEFWHNTSFHVSTNTTPFEAVYGRAPPTILKYVPGEIHCEAGASDLQDRDEALKQLKYHLARAQERMKKSADKHRREVEFAIGDWVFLKLRPHRQQSVLRLPESARIHPVFHVSLLKQAVGNHPVEPTLPQGLEMDSSTPSLPEKCLAVREVSKKGEKVPQWLIQWQQGTIEDATWEDAYAIQNQFPNFRLEDKPASYEAGIEKENDSEQLLDIPAGQGTWKVYKRNKFKKGQMKS
nr:isochorismate synthase [Tanacetum cinerariifolium]